MSRGNDQERQPLVNLEELDTSSDAHDGPHLIGHHIAHFFDRISSRYAANGSINEAWLYFERITLPRRKKDEATGKYTKAAPGAKNTTLYPAWTTRQKELIDFGTGVAIYFATLRALVVICFIAGVLYTPSTLYYASEAFGGSEDAIRGTTLRGSLICPQHDWVPCPDCTLEEWWDNPSRLAQTDDGLMFALKNTCAPLRWREGINHLVVLGFLVLAIAGLGWYQKKTELHYDEEILTASDYSIQVDNPPPQATDPKEWKNFFSQFGNVAYVTVAMNNQDLVQALVKRRGLLQKAAFKLKGRDDAPLQEVPPSLAQSKPLLHKRIQKIDDKCRELLALKYDTSAIFVTFETESAQRRALEALSVGQLNVSTNNTQAVASPQYLFRGNLVLDIFEAVEPSAIRWQDLDETILRKVLERICTGLLTLLMIACGFVLVEKGFEHGPNVAALEITLLNIIMPFVFKAINKLESHPREGSYQASLYVKLSIFRWINTAIVTTMIKPLTVTLDGDKAGLIPAVQAVLRAEIVVAPLLHMLDIAGQVKRQLLAPFAANQPAMNSYFRGSNQFLGEKYTNMTKTIFLCSFYSVIFPWGFLYGAVSLALIYVTDKFLLLRTWAPLPQVGDDVAKLSRGVFFPLSLLALALMSEFYWSAYPFDNLCEEAVLNQDSYPEYIGSFKLTTAGETPSRVKVTLSEGDDMYRFCSQNFLERSDALLKFFTESKEDWMSPAQQDLTFIFGITCVVSLGIMLLVLIYRNSRAAMEEALGGFSTEERDSGESYSDQTQISAYVPQVVQRQFAYPLLACNIKNMNPDHIGWTDPIRMHDYYDMSYDVRALTRQSDNTSGPVLSVVQYWPPGGRNKASSTARSKAATKGYGSMS